MNELAVALYAAAIVAGAIGWAMSRRARPRSRTARRRTPREEMDRRIRAMLRRRVG